MSVKDQTANGDCLLIMSLLYNIFFIYLPLFFDDFLLLDENAETLKCVELYLKTRGVICGDDLVTLV